MLSERNYCRDEVLGCILFKVIVLPTLETVRDICWLANLPEISNTVRATMKTKMATSPTMPAVSHSGFLKILTRFHKKINPQKSSKDFDVQNPEKIINNGATTHRHKFTTTPGFLIQICADLRKNFTKLMQPFDPAALDVQNPVISSTTEL